MKSDRERQILCIAYMWTLKNNTNESTYKTETDSQTENKLTVTKEEREETRGKLGAWD